MACGQMREAHGGLDLVDVLPAVAAGAEGVHSQIFGLHHHVDAIVNFRDHEDRCKRSMPPGSGIKRRNADQPVHARLSGKQSVGVFAFDADRCIFDSGAFARLRVNHRRDISLAFGPAQVHAQQHFRPVLRFGAARTRLDGQNGVEPVALAGKHGAGFELADVFVGRLQFPVGIGEQRLRVARRRSLREPGSGRFRCRCRRGSVFHRRSGVLPRSCAAAWCAAPSPDRSRSPDERFALRDRSGSAAGGRRQR